MAKLISSISNLKPLLVLNPKTGEITYDWDKSVEQLISYIQTQVERSWENHKQEIVPLIKKGSHYKPAEQARQWGYKLLKPEESNPSLTPA